MDDRNSVSVGVLGSYGGRNLGDEAILTALLDRLRADRPDVRIVVFSRDPAYSRAAHPDVEVVGWEGVCRERISEHLRRLSVLVLGGGGILYDTEARRYLRLVRTAQDLGVPVFTYALGAGPLTDETDCAWVRATLSDAAEVTVRDEESKLVLEEAGLTRPITVTADPALLLTPGEGGDELLRAQAVPRDMRLVGMSVREPGRAAEHLDEEGYHQLLANVGDFLVHRLDAHVVFLPMERDDMRHAHAVVSRMADADRCTVLHGTYRPQQMLDIVRRLDLAIGMRLHFLIFAALAGIPLLPLPYAGKVFDFAQQIGAPALRGVVRETAGLLLAEVDRLWDERPDRVAHMTTRTAEMRLRATGTADRLLAYLDRTAPRPLVLAAAPTPAAG
ncbi:polysaccharide pyruvyl transferase [Streptomyces sp. WAC05374]|uniref:polysaccharide pyruvyl transferase family protein n=1 Tax=Streptomyces sp. WAC05374 TaxID=2487420 RepID=UPI00105526B7|nr:polysaccharide pyruvyl transferase family protein [Streptomyces sp. WAC05374]TDF42618.1 polysaccharide pyruvyl transferase [Streptomyces sp. WAC05374]TDF51178.1 polysaccharide pyruvyl transferase [Streptomyces sp. WAC05374]TDF52491.1 polysaccharide pyruvyl transferase [Streptomyces sp. WAC05374]